MFFHIASIASVLIAAMAIAVAAYLGIQYRNNRKTLKEISDGIGNAGRTGGEATLSELENETILAELEKMYVEENHTLRRYVITAAVLSGLFLGMSVLFGTADARNGCRLREDAGRQLADTVSVKDVATGTQPNREER